EMELKNVTFLYKTGRKILDDVTLKIKKGETVGIIGGSGAGKTTLVDVIMGLLVPEKGKVLSDGTDIQDAMRKWHSFIGYVPQTIYLSNATVRENVAFGIEPDRIDDEKVEKALKMAQAWKFVQEMPDKTDTFIGDRGMRISGGQRQRIGIARALYMEPQILVFDEATASLDGETEKALMDSISSLKGGHTMIIIAHRLETLKDCNKIYEVKDGKVTSAFEKVKGRN
ncbi:MAG: ATP-binding cassette domain-containing protein, partial [Lachnospiraceae bacterium]|nr:ATP-binding cassette domain-containing protein [Lachnospiraceae bacterium]